jgi:hypothetical protein
MQVKGYVMKRAKEVPDLRSYFRQSDDSGKLYLVCKIRDFAIQFLQPTIAKNPREVSDEIRESYKAKGISLEWNLTTSHDACEFFFAARDALTESQRHAAELLKYCNEALDKNSVTEQIQQYILDSYAGLDADDVSKLQGVVEKLRKETKKHKK